VAKEPVIHVDARGLRCPLPVLRLRKFAAPGAVVELIADDPAAAVDLPAFAREMGWECAATGALSWRVRVPAAAIARA
jgi:tRNA 2-thiouridine synthesizing protein A